MFAYSFNCTQYNMHVYIELACTVHVYIELILHVHVPCTSFVSKKEANIPTERLYIYFSPK